MADIELVIKIPDHLYKLLKDFPSDSNEGTIENVLMKAVENGTLLPKGHGRIADMDAAIKCIEDVEGEDAIWAICLIDWACSKRTLIEADKEQTE